MANIKIIKVKDSYTYDYEYIDAKKNKLHVTKSGFKTLESALEAAKKSYDYRLKKEKTKIKLTKKEERVPISTRIKNLEITDLGLKLTTYVVYGAIAITVIYGGIKIFNKIKSVLPERQDTDITENDPLKKIITSNDCDFRNLHILLKTNDSETNEVGTITSDMLTRLGISNEIVSDGISEKVSHAIANNPNYNIVVINIECGTESKNKTILMGDFSNNSKYPSDILMCCIKESLKEYGLDPSIRSGAKGDYWRIPTDIENELSNSSLIDKVSQLSISLPTTIKSDRINKVDASTSIVEGIMRWTTLDVAERYKDIYYTAKYGDDIVNIINEHGITIKDIEENSSVNMRKGIIVGDAILVGVIPYVATDNVTATNPSVTINSDIIEEKIITYTVQNGDTVTKIANMYGAKPEDITVPSGNQNNIYVGDIIYIKTYNFYQTHGKYALHEDTQEKQLIK